MAWKSIGPIIELANGWTLIANNEAFDFDEQMFENVLIQYRCPVGIFDVSHDVFELIARVDGGELVGAWWMFFATGTFEFKGNIPSERRRNSSPSQTFYRRLSKDDHPRYPVKFNLPDGGAVTFNEDKTIVVKQS